MKALFSTESLHHMFSLGVPLLEKVLRPWCIYIFLVLGLRLAGKRELAQLTTFDLIVLLTLSNTVQNAIIGDDTSVTGGVIGAISLLVLNYVVVRFLFRRAKLDRLLEGAPIVLMKSGHLQHKAMEREFITAAELETAAHKQGFRGLADVERGILEAGGSITLIGKKPSPTQARHEEIMRRLDELSHQVRALHRNSSE